MVINLFLFVLGGVMLYYGAEWLVKYSSSFAIISGIRPMVVGLTLIAFGTSAPEFVVSLVAAIKKVEGIAVGNIIGSNIANIALILGVASIIAPIKVNKKTIKREFPILIGVTILSVLLMLDGELGQLDGVMMVILLFLFLYYIFKSSKEEEITEEIEVDKGHGKAMLLFLSIIGLVVMITGAKLFVDSASNIARSLGINEVIIGLTIVAIGTSLPELAASTVAALKGHSDISIGNVIGSNIFNILSVFGFVSIFNPINISMELFSFEIPLMLILTIGLFALVAKIGKLNRVTGIIFLVIYTFFLIFTVYSNL